MKKYFGAGPAKLPKEVLTKISEAIIEYKNSHLSILEISQRSSLFLELLDETKQLILELANLSHTTHEVLFLQGGARMEFTRIPFNFIKEKALYLDSGYWANKAFVMAQQIGNVATINTPKNYYKTPEILEEIPQNDYLHITTNNTIYGTQISDFDLFKSRLVADMSSDIFSRALDFSIFDMIYACAQKNLGIAGMSILIFKKDFLEKANTNLPEMLSYRKFIEQNNLLNTPPIFAIFVCNEMLKWIKEKGGLMALEKLNTQKATLLYQEIDRNALFEGLAEKKYRSKMNITFRLKSSDLQNKFDEFCNAEMIKGIKGHRVTGNYRASLYNAVTLEETKKLAEVLRFFEQKFG